MAPTFSSLRMPNELVDMCLDNVESRAALMRARLVSHAMQDAVNRQFCPTRMLGRFVEDVPTLRQIQADIGAVFSGSQVMNFFDGRKYARGKDLDIFLFPKTAKVIGDHLQEKENYVYLGDSWTYDLNTEPSGHMFSLYNSANVRRVYKFAKGDLMIDLVACTECPVQSILSFHCTPVVNGILWDRAFSCFAFATWERREGMVLDRWNPAVNKYRKRGFKVYDVRVALSHRFHDSHDSLRMGHRWVGDRDTWVLPLDTQGLTPPSTNQSLDHSSFTVIGVPTVSGPGILKQTAYRISTVCYRNSLLRHPSAVAPLLWRFADTAMTCTRAHWRRSGAPFGPRVAIGAEVTGYERVFSWERFFSIVCMAWRTSAPLTVAIDGVTIVFFPLGGTVYNSRA